MKTAPPSNVDVAVVEVAWKYSATTGPTTESFAYGVEVPIPTLPVEELYMNPVESIVSPLARFKLPLSVVSPPTERVPENEPDVPENEVLPEIVPLEKVES